MKSFYYVRHGQTDFNLKEGKNKGDHLGDVPLNATGRAQAKAIEPLIARLPIRTICCSPMRRAVETKEIIAERLRAAHVAIDDLRECNKAIWDGMRELGMYSPLPESGHVRLFMDRVKKGIDEALQHEAPALVIAHGGVHWALCCLSNIVDHPWAIDNCAIVHFTIHGDGIWKAKLLS